MSPLSKYLIYTISSGLIFLCARETVAQSVVTIVGDPVQSEDPHDYFSNNDNPYMENNVAPPQQQYAELNTGNIEPSLENGFHVRFTLDEPVPSESMSSGYMSSGGSGAGVVNVRRKTSPDAYVFNLRKKIKSWLPERKKKYRPHLCGRF